jgi:hypothetical protein
MAVGDVIKSLSFTQFSEIATFAAPCSVGNSIVVVTTTNGGSQSCSDSVNGAYEKIEEVISAGADFSLATFLVQVTDGSTAPTITLGNPSLRTYAYEVQGALSYAGLTASNDLGALTAGASVPFTSGTATIPANNFSLGIWSATAPGSGITVAAPWAVEAGGLGGFRVASRVDATEAVGAEFSGDYGGQDTSKKGLVLLVSFSLPSSGPDYTQRKGSTFDATHTLGTITTATLNGVSVFDHVSSQTAGTVSFAGALTDEITTSGVYNLVLGDGAATQTQTVQVNVFGVVPSNNPAQKDGSALASLTGIQIRITAGANLNGTQVYYSPTETTDASGNFSTLDVSPSAAVAADPVRMQVLTAAGDSITSAETVGLI